MRHKVKSLNLVQLLEGQESQTIQQQ